MCPSGNRVMYVKSGEKWFRHEWKEQCDKDIFMGSKCQGVKGHSENHWCYSPNGWLCQNLLNGGASQTPPGHENYVDPLTQQHLWYINFCKIEEVTDPEIFANLEAGNPPEEFASMDRPITEEEAEKEFGPTWKDEYGLGK